MNRGLKSYELGAGAMRGGSWLVGDDERWDRNIYRPTTMNKHHRD